MALARPIALALTVFGAGVSFLALAQEAPPSPAPADVQPPPPAAPAQAIRPPRRYYWHLPPAPDGSSDAPNWTWWLGAAAGARDLPPAPGPIRADAELRLGLGLELKSFRAARYHQLQVGPWIQAAGDLGGAVGEGGLELGVTKEDYNGSFFGLRAGGGYGLGPGDRGAELTGSLLFGLRHSFGPCAHLYHARGWRIFATARTWVTEGRGITVVAGFEIDPSLLFSGEDDGYWDLMDHRVEYRCFRGL